MGDFNNPLRNWETENQHVFYSHFGIWYVLYWHKIEVRKNAILANWEIYVCIIICACKCLYLDRKIKNKGRKRKRHKKEKKIKYIYKLLKQDFPGDTDGKNLPAMQETWIQSLCWEDILRREWLPTPSTIAWKIPYTEEPDNIQPIVSQRLRHDWVAKHTPNY